MAAAGKPPGPDDDAITYLPIDRSAATERPFGPTDPRASQALGGIRLGKSFVFVLDDQMARLEPHLVAQACDNVVKAQETYASLLYLGRARVADAPALFEASQSPEIKVRWERLWVLSPYLSRLARHDDGRAALLAAFGEDLAGVHLLSKFVEQNNAAVKKLFARLHTPLLTLLLERLVQYRADPRRASLLSSIVGCVETHEDKLRAALPADLDDEAAAEILSYLYVKRPGAYGSRLSSVALRDRLSQWRRD